MLARREIKANFEYFLQTKIARLEYLAKYLAAFSIDLQLSAEVLPALDRWLHRYGGHLLPRKAGAIDVLMDYEPAWVGEYLGLNIVHDLAIFAGDYIVSKNKDVRWDAHYGNGTKRDYEEMGFGQPCLFGLRQPGYRRPHLMQDEIFLCCSAGRSRLRSGNKSVVVEWDIPGEFTRLLNYLADPNSPTEKPIAYRHLDDPNFEIDD